LKAGRLYADAAGSAAEAGLSLIPSGIATVEMTDALSEQRLRRRDAFLAGAADDMWAHDRRLAGVAVDVGFDRGVAHLTGEVSRWSDLALVRRLVGRLDGVLAVWDRVRVAGRDPVILDLGCGDNPQYPDNVGIDCRPGKAVALLADLADGVPCDNGTADTIFTVHVLEHLVDYLPLLDDCHRVLRPDGVLHLLAPSWRHVNAVADPTHVRLFDVQTIKSICLRPKPAPRWSPLHVATDGVSVFADLRPCVPDEAPEPAALGRFFD
jgi:SAM-dependent methyltransferase